MEGGGNAWTTFVKKWSVDNKTPYLCAISTPEVSAAYRATKKAKKEEVKNTTFQSLKEQAIALASVGLAPKKPRGRPKKYATAAEAKAAKIAKTIESNKKSYAKKTEAKTKGKVGRPERRMVVREVRDADEDAVARIVAESNKKDAEAEAKKKESKAQIEAWKKEYGDGYEEATALGKTSLYIFGDTDAKGLIQLYHPKTGKFFGLYDPENSEIEVFGGGTIFLNPDDNQFEPPITDKDEIKKREAAYLKRTSKEKETGDEDEVDVYEITIEGKDYLMDMNNNIYSIDDQKVVGIYDPSRKGKIIHA